MKTKLRIKILMLYSIHCTMPPIHSVRWFLSPCRLPCSRWLGEGRRPESELAVCG